MPNHHDEPLLERYQREHREFERIAMSEHTSGKLELEEVANDSSHIKHLCPVDSEGMSILTVVDHEGVKFAATYHDADARRLVACWNYADGLDTECMEQAVSMNRSIKAFINESYEKELELLAERDRLSAINAELIAKTARVLRSFPTDFDMRELGWTSSEIEEACNAHESARAAITKAQGEQA